MDEAFEGDLGFGGDRQAGRRPPDDADRLAEQAAGRLVFVLAIGNFEPGDGEQAGMDADHHGDRARLAALVIAAHEMSPCLPLEIITEAVPVVHLDAVGAVIDPAGIRVLHDHHAAGADVIAAVALVPARRRNLQEIDRLARKTFSNTAPVLTPPEGWSAASRI